MSKPLHLTTKMDLVCRGLDFEANVTLDYFHGVKPTIRLRREDCEPGQPAYCAIRNVEVLTADPELPAFTTPELFQAAESAAESRIDAISVEAERDGRYEADKPLRSTEDAVRIQPLAKPVLAEPAAPVVSVRELASPSV